MASLDSQGWVHRFYFLASYIFSKLHNFTAIKPGLYILYFGLIEPFKILQKMYRK